MFGSSSWRLRRNLGLVLSTDVHLSAPAENPVGMRASDEPGPHDLTSEQLGARTHGSSRASRSARRVAEQALLDERLQVVDVRVGDLLGGLERAAAGEDREPREELLLVGVSSS